ncbi:MAG: RNA polymerase subunit sigma-70, partial [Odoribacter sp.]|nr:RNA polymerase subunit sigma-70 [Odoribacter sp.]
MKESEFISLILPLKDRLFRIEWHIVRSREEAEDIVQEVMMKVWDM